MGASRKTKDIDRILNLDWSCNFYLKYFIALMEAKPSSLTHNDKVLITLTKDYLITGSLKPTAHFSGHSTIASMLIKSVGYAPYARNAAFYLSQRTYGAHGILINLINHETSELERLMVDYPI